MIKLRIVDAAPGRGVAWVVSAFGLFFRQPLAFTMLLLLFVVAALILMLVPYLGPVLLLAALPLLTLGFMAAGREASAGRPVRLGALVESLAPGAEPARRAALLRLCLLYAVLTAAAMLGADAIDGGSFSRLQRLVAQPRTEALNREIDAALADPQLQLGVLLRFAASTLLALPFWHAPALVAWHGQGVAQSLFSSTLACWRNKAAFTLYSLAWVAALVAFGMLAGVLLALLGNAQLITTLALPAGLMFCTVFYVSLHATFAGCFANDDGGGAPPAPVTPAANDP
jgi:hypothetical protein